MGDDPKTSAVNRYLQSWDVPNLFVMGATRLPAERRLQPDRHGRRAGLLGGGGDPRTLPEESRPAGARPEARAHAGALPALAARCCSAPLPAGRSADSDHLDQVERGRYLATAGDCIACHTAPAASPSPAAGRSRRRSARSIAPNITPDRGDRHRRLDRRRVLPRHARRHRPRRRAALSGLSLSLLHQGQPRRTSTRSAPICAPCRRSRNARPRNTLPFPFNIRAVMRRLEPAVLHAGDVPARPGRAERMEPRRLSGRRARPLRRLPHAEELPRRRQDGRCLPGRRAAGLVRAEPDRRRAHGLGDWSAEEIVEYLEDRPQCASRASGPMARGGDAIRPPDDATPTCARSPSTEGPARRRARAAARARRRRPGDGAGEAIYLDNCRPATAATARACRRCSRPWPAARWCSSRPTTLIAHRPGGSRGGDRWPRRPAPAMPAFAWRLRRRQVAEVATYIRNSWGNQAPAAGPEDAARLRDLLAAGPR